jgi:hypothetical protein
MLVQKLLKPCGKIGENYNIECHNCFHEKPLWGKIKKIDINLVLTLPH